jgi:hypothetical protein
MECIYEVVLTNVDNESLATRKLGNRIAFVSNGQFYKLPTSFLSRAPERRFNDLAKKSRVEVGWDAVSVLVLDWTLSMPRKCLARILHTQKPKHKKIVSKEELPRGRQRHLSLLFPAMEFTFQTWKRRLTETMRAKWWPGKDCTKVQVHHDGSIYHIMTSIKFCVQNTDEESYKFSLKGASASSMDLRVEHEFQEGEQYVLEFESHKEVLFDLAIQKVVHRCRRLVVEFPPQSERRYLCSRGTQRQE